MRRAMQSVEHLTPGSIFARDFRVVRILGQGGMGAVYEAEQADGGRRVALKLMHPSQVADARLRKRFAQEACVGRWIGSEHIVEVHRAGVDEASRIPWIAMELLQGETLAARIARHLPSQGLAPDDAWRILSQLCRALSAAHDKGVVHRDLKPENVFLAAAPHGDAPFTVKVLDFGIAKRLDPHDRAQNRTTAIGTPLWMAPEQNHDAEITPAADVWALGLVTFRMFTGRYYWLSANEPELNLARLYSELVTEALPTASMRADVLGRAHLLPARFDAWFARAVARDPRHRFAHAREAAEALASIAPPSFAPFARGQGSLTPTPEPTLMLTSAPQIPSSPTVVLSAPPPAPMPSSPPPLAGSVARERSRLVLGLLAVAVLVAGAVAVTWAMRADEGDKPAPPVAPASAVPAMPAAPAVPVEPPQPPQPLVHPQIEPAPVGPIAPAPMPRMPPHAGLGTK